MKLLQIRLCIYDALVNRKPEIGYRYHKYHDGTKGFGKVLSWGYLLWLNFGCYVLRREELGAHPKYVFFEQKKVPVSSSETELDHKENPDLTPEFFISQAKKYDIISFDIFDTLIFRPLDEPDDLFYFVGEKLGFLNFRKIRIWAEDEARKRKQREKGTTEVTLAEIWEVLSEETGLEKERGIRAEIEAELELCYANPFMRIVWNAVRDTGKRVIVTSDMYLPQDVLRRILEDEGFTGYEELRVSCEYEKNKQDGNLFAELTGKYSGKKILHIGDNIVSDVKNARAAGIDALHYPPVRRNIKAYRPYDMSYVIGSAYRGIISNWLYNGTGKYSMEYEYGFIYGGLFVLGYCNFIHEYAKLHQIGRLLFLSRDGDILKNVYDRLFPGGQTVYTHWSRMAGVKLMADLDRREYFRRFIFHKANKGYTIRSVLHAMDLDALLSKLPEMNPEDELTSKNMEALKATVLDSWPEVLEEYEEQRKATERYFRDTLAGVESVAVIDIGWMGSAAITLSKMITEVWEIPCEVYGLLAGTSTLDNEDPDAGAVFVQRGRLCAYMFSDRHDRDLLKKHVHEKGTNYDEFWEILISSPQPHFKGYYADGPHFGENDAYPEGSVEIQKGIMDFAEEYSRRYKDFPYMMNISGRDAYAPFMVATGSKERYLKSIVEKFEYKTNVE